MGHSAVRAAWLAGANPEDTTTDPGTVRARVQLPLPVAGGAVLITCTLYQDPDQPGRTIALRPVAVGQAHAPAGETPASVDVTLTPFVEESLPSPERPVLIRTDITYCGADILLPFTDEWRAAVTTTAAVATFGPVATEGDQHVTLTSTLTQQSRPGAHGRDAFALGLETRALTGGPDTPTRLLVAVNDDWGGELDRDQVVLLTNEVRFTCSSLLQPGADSPKLQPKNLLVLPTWSMWDWDD